MNCGPNGWKYNIVTNNWFIGGWYNSEDLSDACEIHDKAYELAVMSRVACDLFFYSRMIHQIETCAAPYWIKAVRRFQAWVFYRAVRKFGAPYYRGSE